FSHGVNPLWLMRQRLQDEKEKALNRKMQIENEINAVNQQVAHNFARIIAQAISRSLDLMGQVKKVGKIRSEEIQHRITAIDIALNETTSTAVRAKMVNDPCLNKYQAELAISNRVRGVHEHAKEKNRLDLAPVLNLSFSNVVLGHIASLGKLIITNLVDDNGSVQQVATFPTSIVVDMQLRRHLNVHFLDKFHEALLLSKQRRTNLDDRSYSQIGRMVAPMIVIPPRTNSVQIVAEYDPVLGVHCYRLRNPLNGVEAGDKLAVNNPNV
ncbi:hypothetical protein PFISCL1PPCAC_21544, partial [Pristionchus fissidentatus]